MKTMHFGVLHHGPEDLLPDDFKLPEGVKTFGDSFMQWGEITPEDMTLHLVYDYATHLLPNPEEAAYRPHLLTANGPVRGWLKSQGVYDRERLQVAVLREQIAEALPECCRLIDYVVISDHDDHSEDQHLWTLDGIMSRTGS